MRWRFISSPSRSGAAASSVAGLARLLLVAGVVGATGGCSTPHDASLPGVREGADSSAVALAEPLYAKRETAREADRTPAEDGPPIGGPSRTELMRLPDAVPSPEPPSRHGNPHAYIVHGRTYRTLASSRGYVERGIASWYGRKFHERPTSSREPYDMFAMTAAHRSLPLPTYVRVTHLENGRSVVLRVNDRGPFHPGRIIDLSYAAAVKLDIADPGSAPVEVRAIELEGFGRSAPPPRAAPVALEYFVQVGAYSNEDNAARALRLADRVRPGMASLRAVHNPERTLHRVRIGPLRGPEEADRVLAGLSEAGLGSARVVIETRSDATAEDDNA